MAECVITGCALMRPENEAYSWGDLHVQGDQYIFNAVQSNDGEAFHFDDLDERLKTAKRVSPGPGDEVFERRGVVIFPAESAVCNELAVEYMK